MPKNKKVTAIVPVRNVGSIVAPATIVVPAVSGGGKKKSRGKAARKRAKRARARDGMVMPQTVEECWLRSLNDPFSHAPLPLGLGCMYPTQVVQAYARGYFPTSTDGSFQLWLSPGHWNNNSSSTGSFIVADNAGVSTTPTFAVIHNGATDAGAIQSDFDQFRVLSAGLRVIHAGAFTSGTGVMSSVLYPQDVGNTVPIGTGTGVIVTNLVTLPQADWGRTIDPLELKWRPVEGVQLETFQSTTSVMSFSALGLPPVLGVASLGGPASSNVFYEGIVHLECFSVSRGVIGGTNIKSNSVKSNYETIGGMFGSIRDALSPVSESVLELAKEATHTAAQSALAAGLGMMKARVTNYTRRSQGSNWIDIRSTM